MREVRIGLVGAGWMGKVHAMAFTMARQAFGPEPAVPVFATVCDVNAELSQKAARDIGYERWTTDWRDIVNDPKIDVVDICTPNDMHYDVAMAAIEAGKHVYCEKPLANSLKLAREMKEAAEKKGIITFVGFNYVQNPVQTLAREAIRRGDIGKPRYARIHFNCSFMADPNLQHTWRNDIKRAGSGMVGDVGAHCLSYFFYLTELEVTEVICNLEFVFPDPAAPLGAGSFVAGQAGHPNKRIPNTTDDIATIMFKFPGGSGHMECSRVSTGFNFDIGYEIVGSTGSLRYKYDRINDIEIHRDSGPVEQRGFTHIEMGPTDPYYLAMQPVAGLGLGYNDYKAIEARKLLVAVAENRKLSPDFDFGYRVQRVVEACQRSHAERRWVKIAEVA